MQHLKQSFDFKLWKKKKGKKMSEWINY